MPCDTLQQAAGFFIEEEVSKMRSKVLVITICLIILTTFGMLNCFGGDLDDGISTYTEDSIHGYDDLGKPDRNIKFIKLKAKSRAKVKARKSDSQSGSNSETEKANMNSVVMGAGGVIKGDVIIIDESKGDKTQIVDK
ncbi:MAG: hypothetical protein ABIF87_04365 [Pseudomonadota bacterium]